MKERLLFEEVFNQLIRQPGFVRKLLIGGSISFVPFLNIFAFGYLYRFSIASIMFCSALYRLHMYSDYKALLDVTLILQMSCAGVFGFILPILVFTGLCMPALPLYGFAFFLGFLFLISQTSLYFRAHELRH